MSDTPETDAVWKGTDTIKQVMTSRRLERERDEARELADSYRIAFCSANGMDKVPNPFPWEVAK
jgi:hypothetical protein